MGWSCVLLLHYYTNNKPNNDGEPLLKKHCSSKQLSLKTFFKSRNANWCAVT